MPCVISHSGGVERVPFELLPDGIRREFKLEPEKVAAFRLAAAQREQARASKAGGKKQPRPS